MCSSQLNGRSCQTHEGDRHTSRYRNDEGLGAILSWQITAEERDLILARRTSAVRKVEYMIYARDKEDATYAATDIVRILSDYWPTTFGSVRKMGEGLFSAIMKVTADPAEVVEGAPAFRDVQNTPGLSVELFIR